MRKLLSICLAALTFCAVASAAEGPTPYPVDNKDWPGKGIIRKFGWMDQNRQYYWTQREKAQGSVVFVGDSLTQNWKMVTKDFPGLKIANRGIGGDTSRGVLFRFKEDVLDLNPKAVIILIGINDLTAHGKPADTLSNLTEMLDQAAKQNPAMPVIICTIPATENPKAPVKAPDREAINAGLVKLAADRENVELCDTAKALAAADGSFVPENFNPDKLHIAPPGYAKWLEAIKPIFEQLKLAEAAK